MYDRKKIRSAQNVTDVSFYCSGDDVLITGARFVEPGNPTVLARHFAKQEVMKRQKVRFDVSHYAHLSISEVLSGYLSQVHSSRDWEIEMVQ